MASFVDRRRIALGVYIAAVNVAAVVAIAGSVLNPFSLADSPEAGWLLLVALAGIAILLERTRTDLFGDSKVSLSFVPLFTVALLFGPAVAGVGAAGVILVAQAPDAAQWYKRLFNASTVALAVVVGSTAFLAFAGPPAAERIGAQLLPAVIAAEVTFFANSAMVATVVGIVSGRSPVGVWTEKFRWIAPHYGALGLAAYATAIAYLQMGAIGMAVFMLPVGMLWLAVRQYADRSRADVSRLQHANQALTRSEERFRSLVQNSPGFVAVLERDGSLQYMSRSPDASEERPAWWRPDHFTSLVRPSDAPRVRAMIEAAAANPGADLSFEFEYRQADGGWCHYDAVVTNLLDTEAVAGIVINAHDVTEQKALERELRHQALHDPLTRLPNRALFMDRLERALEVARREQRTVAVIFLDLDRFKVLNDSLGHSAGDELLVSLAERLTAAAPVGETVARFGGDEFTILLEDVEAADHAVAVAESLLAAISVPMQLRGHEHKAVVSACMGIALSDGERVAPRDLIRQADIALFRAKGEGHGQCVLFDEELDAFAAERFELEGDLRLAVERNELRLYYQPEIDLRTHEVIGFEALVRWQHPSRGLVPPDEFIPLAEETGEIVAIGHWVLEEACRQAREWQERLMAGADFTMSMNLSAKEFLQPDLVWRVATTLGNTGLDPRTLRIEITESALLRDTPIARTVFLDLKGLGVQLAIDDFGTGYSSLNYLRQLPADVLKIDRSFVADVDRDPREAAIVRAVLNIAEALEMRVVAEGIERREQLELLAAMGCPAGQGYYFLAPMAPAEVETYVRSSRKGRLAA